MKKIILLLIAVFISINAQSQCTGVTVTGTTKAKVFKSCYDTTIVASKLATVTADSLSVKKIYVTGTHDQGSPDAAVSISRILNGNHGSGHGYNDGTDFRDTTNSYCAYNSSPVLNSTGADNYEHIISFQSNCAISTNGNVNQMIGFGDYNIINSSASHTSEVLGFVSSPDNSIGGHIGIRKAFEAYDAQNVDNNFGLYIHNITANTLAAAIYSDGVVKSYHRGFFGLNTDFGYLDANCHITGESGKTPLLIDDDSHNRILQIVNDTKASTFFGSVTATSFIGPLIGNSSTATALQTARTINGTSFNGTANITISAAANTLTGTTLASGVTVSSLTSFGSSPTLVTPLLGTPTSGVLTNCSGTASALTAGNVTTNANLTGPITSSGNATSIASQTGTTTTFVMQDSPVITTQAIIPTLYGSSTSGGSLQLNSTSNATKGFIYLSTASGYDATKQFLGIGTQTPAALLHLSGNITASAWTTSGIGIRDAAATYTDNTSATGTVSAVYGNYYGIKTFNSTNASVVVTNLYGNYFEAPAVTGNVTATTKYAAGFGAGIQVNGDIKQAAGAAVAIGTTDVQSLQLISNNAIRLTFNSNGLASLASTALSSGTTAVLRLTQPNNTGGSAGIMLVTAGTTTSQTTATNITDINYDLSAVMKVVDGTTTLMRGVLITGRTYTPQTSALTVTKATGLSVIAPVAGSGTTITTNAAIECSGNLLLPNVGNKIFLKEGSGGFMGQVALVSGTKAITVTGVTTSTRCFLQLVSPSGVALTIESQCACTANTVTIQANVAAGTINTSDNSTYNYLLFEPAP